jgi:uncharacterized protein (TIGR02452 family)
MAAERTRRIQVWEETKKRYQAFPIQESIIYDTYDPTIILGATKKYPNTQIEFLEDDCVDVALKHVEEGLHPLILNMASDYNPGGGVAKGSAAQEEELFRRSNYYKHLHRTYYPQPPVPLRTILSKGVEFYRYSGYDDFQLMEKPVKMDCVAAAALRDPNVTMDESTYKNPKDTELMEQKIRMLFQVAIQNGNTSLVLSAWGCGAFCNPVPQVAKLFRKIADEHRGFFRKITFAILGKNFKAFKNAYYGK